MLLRLASDVYPFTCVLSVSSQNKAGAQTLLRSDYNNND